MKSKTDLLEFSVTSYEISLNQSQRGDKRGRGMNYNQFIHDMKMLDQEILDLSPPSSRFEKKIQQKIHIRRVNFILGHTRGIPCFLLPV